MQYLETPNWHLNFNFKSMISEKYEYGQKIKTMDGQVIANLTASGNSRTCQRFQQKIFKQSKACRKLRSLY